MRTLLTLLILISVSTFGQSKKIGFAAEYSTIIPFSGEYFVQTGANIGLKNQLSSNWDITYGLGVDFNFEEDLIDPFLFIPVFVKFSQVNNDKKVSTLFSIKPGYMIDFNQDPYFDYSFFLEPRLGVQVRFGSVAKLRTGLGYNALLYKEYEDWFSYSSSKGPALISHAISLFVGFTF